MKRIYVAGPYSANNVIDVLNNMRRGMKMAKDVFLAGYAVFCPWIDHHFTLMLDEGESLSVDDYYAYSLAWMEASDAVLVLPNYEHSKGTVAEIERARSKNIPVFFDLDALIKEMPASGKSTKLGQGENK